MGVLLIDANRQVGTERRFREETWRDVERLPVRFGTQAIFWNTHAVWLQGRLQGEVAVIRHGSRRRSLLQLLLEACYRPNISSEEELHRGRLPSFSSNLKGLCHMKSIDTVRPDPISGV